MADDAVGVEGGVFFVFPDQVVPVAYERAYVPRKGESVSVSGRRYHEVLGVRYEVSHDGVMTALVNLAGEPDDRYI